MFNFMRILAVAAFAASGSLAYALDANDVVNLSKARAGDEVIVAQIKAAKARFTLTADDIIRLKKEGVSDTVIKAMIESAAAQPPSEPAPAPAPAQPEPQKTGAPEPEPARIAEPQPAQTTIIEKHYYETPTRVYYTEPVTTYYVPSRPVCYPVYRSAYYYDSRHHNHHPDLNIYGQVRVNRHLSIGFRF